MLLAEALQSISKQSYPKIEIIVVNDGGDDASEVILPFNSVNMTIVLVQFPVSQGRSKAPHALALSGYVWFHKTRKGFADVLL